MKKKKRGKLIHPDQVELARRIRKDWGDIRPVTQVVPSKKRYTRKEKHKQPLGME